MPSSVPNIGNASINFGTCVIGNVYGQVESASLERTAEEVGIPDCNGSLQAMLLVNPGFTFNLSAIFPSTGALPVLGEAVAFPEANVTGNVMSFTVNWSNREARKITLTAKYWDSIGTNPTVGTLAP